LGFSSLCLPGPPRTSTQARKHKHRSTRHESSPRVLRWRSLRNHRAATCNSRRCVRSPYPAFVPACETCQSSFAILGDTNSNNQHLSLCETLAVGDGEHWELMAPNHESRTGFACAAVPGCIMDRRRWIWSQISRSFRRGARPLAAFSVRFPSRRRPVLHGQHAAINDLNPILLKLLCRVACRRR